MPGPAHPSSLAPPSDQPARLRAAALLGAGSARCWRPWPRLLSLVLLGSAWWSPSPSLAQDEPARARASSAVEAEPPDESTSPAEAERAESPKPEPVPRFDDELDVRAEIWARRLREVPAHIRFVDREQIESTAARTLAEAVEWTPGVRLESNCQSCNTSRARLLGLDGPYTQILVEGQPTVSSLALVYGLEQVPARLIDGLEVVKGGGSSVYGAGAVGGVIDLVPHQPVRDRLVLEVRGSSSEGAAGNGGGDSVSALFDRVDRDGIDALSLLAQVDGVDPVDVDGDGFTEVARRRLESWVGRYERRAFAGAGRLHAELNRTEAERRGGDLLRIDLPADQSALAEEIFTERLGASLGWLHMPSAALDYRLSLSWADSDRASYYGADFDPDAYGTTRNPLWSVDFQANHHRDRGLWTWGVQAQRDEIDDRQAALGRTLDEAYETTGFYVQAERELYWGRAAGGRAAGGRAAGGRAAGGSTRLHYGVRLDDHSELARPVLSPRLALLFAPRPSWVLRASYARGFRPPQVFDEDLHVELLGGGEPRRVQNAEDLREERSAASLLSAEWRPELGGRWAAVVEVNLFRIELDDLFDVRDADDPSTLPFEAVRENFGDGAVQGVELVAGLRQGARWSAELAFTEQSSRYGQPEPDFGSRDFFRSPDRYGLLSFDFELPKGFDLFFGLRYTGSMKAPHYAGFIDRDRLETTDDFLSADLRLGYGVELPKGQVLGVSLAARNLTNAFQQDLDRGPQRDSSYVYGPRFPRTWSVGISWEL